MWRKNSGRESERERKKEGPRGGGEEELKSYFCFLLVGICAILIWRGKVEEVKRQPASYEWMDGKQQPLTVVVVVVIVVGAAFKVAK